MNALLEIPARLDYVDSVHNALVDAIVEGSLPPGSRITQEDIAERLRVSRSPVVQAFRLLKEEGLLQDAPKRGLVVTPLDPQRIGQLYDVRGALDALAVRLAAERQAVIDPSIIATGRAAAEAGVLKAMIDADMAFHNAIYAASGNPLIAESTHRHWVHLRRVMGAVHRAAAGARSNLWDEHQAIAEAIGQGDAERAVMLSDLHIRRAKTNVLAKLETIVLDVGERA